MLKKLSLLVALIASQSTYAQAQSAPERTDPECLNEALTKKALLAALSRPDLLSGQDPKPPGEEAMPGPYGDPLFQDPAWVKQRWTQYFHDTAYSGGNTIRKTRYTVVIHFFFNKVTKVAAQIKFKNTVEAGCVGVNFPIDKPIEKAEIIDFTQMIQGASPSHLGTTAYSRERTATVTVGPIVPRSEAAMSWDGLGGAWGDGSSGGFAGMYSTCRFNCGKYTQYKQGR